VAIDANNTVWVASSGNNRIARFNRTTGAQLGTTDTCGNPIGVGVACGRVTRSGVPEIGFKRPL
jgi:DNA-binding beta-propeller fold protein YncE